MKTLGKWYVMKTFVTVDRKGSSPFVALKFHPPTNHIIHIVYKKSGRDKMNIYKSSDWRDAVFLTEMVNVSQIFRA